MNLPSILLWGFVATLCLSTLMGAGQMLRFSRMSMPLLLGTAFTPSRERALVAGFAFHIVNGWLFAFVYALMFESWRMASWWIGLLAGIVHGLFVLLVVLPMLPSLHPRMASETRGPTPTRQLQPAGFMGLHYGRGVPIVILTAHAVYGLILGAGYRLL